MDKKELDILIEDLRFMKEASKRNGRILREILLPKYFGSLTLYCGISFVILFTVFHIFIQNFGSYKSVPLAIRSVLWIIFIFIFASTVILKWTVIGKATRKIRSDVTPLVIVKEILSSSIKHGYISLVFTIFFLTLFLVITANGIFVIPLLSIICGISINTIDGTMNLKEYLFFGYWLIFSGIAGILFAGSYPFLCPAFTFGIGMIIFGIAALLSVKNKIKLSLCENNNENKSGEDKSVAGVFRE